jgi:hypothetical protein
MGGSNRSFRVVQGRFVHHPEHDHSIIEFDCPFCPNSGNIGVEADLNGRYIEYFSAVCAETKPERLFLIHWKARKNENGEAVVGESEG